MSPPGTEYAGYESFEQFLEFLRNQSAYDIVDSLNIHRSELLEAFEDRALAIYTGEYNGEDYEYREASNLPLDFSRDD